MHGVKPFESFGVITSNVDNFMLGTHIHFYIIRLKANRFYKGGILIDIWTMAADKKVLNLLYTKY